MKVIMVEDNSVYNDYICNFLEKGGFNTSTNNVLLAYLWPGNVRKLNRRYR